MAVNKVGTDPALPHAARLIAEAGLRYECGTGHSRRTGVRHRPAVTVRGSAADRARRSGTAVTLRTVRRGSDMLAPRIG